MVFIDTPIGFGHSQFTRLLYIYFIGCFEVSDGRSGRSLVLSGSSGCGSIMQRILRSIVGHSIVHTHNGLGASTGRFTKLGRFIGHSATSADTSPTGRHNLCSLLLGLVSCYFGVVSIHACVLDF